jgi:tyrosine-protein kinase Etk/Wzc
VANIPNNNPAIFTPSVGNSPGAQIQEEGGISLVDIVENVLFFRWYFLVTFSVIFCLGILFALFSSPIYIADALIQVEEKKGSSLGALSQVAKVLDVQQSPVLGEIEILRSRTVIGSAVEAEKANITIAVDNRLPIFGGWLSRILGKGPDGLAKPLWNSSIAWGGEELKVQKFVVPQSLYGESLFLTIGPERTWILADDEGNELLKGQGTEQMSESADGKISLSLANIKARPGTIFKLKVYSTLSRIGSILGRMTAAETKRQSGIIKVTFEGNNPAQTAQMLTAITTAYVDQNVSRRSEEAEKSLEFLNKELPRLKADLEVSEQNLNTFRNEKKTLDVPGEIKELLTQTTNTEKARQELELKRKQFQVQYQPDYPLLKAINAQLKEVQTQSVEIEKRISSLPQTQQDYIRKARDVEVNNQLYVSLLNNAQQLQIAKAGTVGNVAVVDPAVIPERPSRPNKPLTVAIAALLGLALGFVICQLLAFITGVVRDPKKLEQTIGQPILGVVPLSTEQVDAIEREEDGEVGAYMLAQMEPTSTVVESLRTLRTSILFSLAEKSNSKVLLLTSAVPSQGKSFLSANLSYLLAAAGKKVLLVEADVRRASIRRYINFNPKDPGLSSVLMDDVDPHSVIMKEVYPNMDFLPAGPRVKNPGDMLSTDRLKNLMAHLRTQYDYVFIDSPPLLPVNDARALAQCADITMFAVRQEMVSVTEVREALEIFAKSGQKIDGMIFNGFIPSRIRYGYNYGYGYGGIFGYIKYGRRYGRYGRYGNYGKGYGPKFSNKYGSYGPDSETDPKDSGKP